jgi:hypothetical protein
MGDPRAFWPDDDFDPGAQSRWLPEASPALVMVGTADPATPTATPYRIVEHWADGYLVIEEWRAARDLRLGNACVDDLVTASGGGSAARS